jgi:Rrf2 family protein
MIQNSSACNYAVRAMRQMAVVARQGRIRVTDLCQDTDMPRHFIAKIFRRLVHAGLLDSTKGRHGGFALARTAKDISLYEVVSAIDGEERFERCVLGLRQCDEHQPCPQHDAWIRVRDMIRGWLERTPLASATTRDLEFCEKSGKACHNAATCRKPHSGTPGTAGTAGTPGTPGALAAVDAAHDRKPRPRPAPAAGRKPRPRPAVTAAPVSKRP